MPKRIMRVTKQCERETCVNEFEVPVSGKASGRKYCDRDCASKATAQARGDAYKASHGYVPPVCPCGKTIVATAGWGYAYSKKYCDDECRRKYAPVRQRDESKWETYTCKNPSCGQTFTRRKNSRNAKHYCSMACSNTMTKKKHHIVLRDDDIVLDSSWEAFFYGACKIAKIPIQRFQREYGVTWREGNVESWYAPDFFIDEHQLAIEIKGLEDDHDRCRWSAYRTMPAAEPWHDNFLVIMNRERLLALKPETLYDDLWTWAKIDNPGFVDYRKPIASVVKP